MKFFSRIMQKPNFKKEIHALSFMSKVMLNIRSCKETADNIISFFFFWHHCTQNFNHILFGPPTSRNLIVCNSLTFNAGNGIGFDICTASPVFSSIWAYNVGHCKHESEYLI